MVELGGTFDPNAVEPSKPMELLPDGWYQAMVIESDIKMAQSGNKYMALTFQIDESRHPNYANRRVWVNLNLWNSNSKAQEIAQRDLSAICRAMGLGPVSDTEQLHHRQIAILVKTRKPRGAGEQESPQNEVKGYGDLSKLSSGSVTPAQAGAQAQQAVQQQKQQAQASQTSDAQSEANTGESGAAGDGAAPW